jgi:hypothetical protein
VCRHWVHLQVLQLQLRRPVAVIPALLTAQTVLLLLLAAGCSVQCLVWRE